ncbi:unnamed protein product [marine sediment metagenome]|uniref:Uncharacterized protein n=1 Tax=marine sediment metagenome TaxID=412755 RepID=X0UZE9_9ZZZZ
MPDVIELRFYVYIEKVDESTLFDALTLNTTLLTVCCPAFKYFESR